MPDFVVSTEIPASPSAVYNAWIDAEQHAAFTGAPATSDPRVGGPFTAWHGYISGTYSALTPGLGIEMAWRTTQFAAGDADAAVSVRLEPTSAGTRITLTQSGSPDGQAASYEAGWEQYYFAPLRAFFAR